MVSMNDDLARVLRLLRDGLAAQYGDRLDRVLLYGSRARGDARPECRVRILRCGRRPGAHPQMRALPTQPRVRKA